MANVIVVTYNHRHGTDCNVYASAELAIKGTAEICVENMDEGELDEFDKGEDAKKLIAREWKQAKPNYQAIVDAYTECFQEASYPETFETFVRGIITE